MVANKWIKWHGGIVAGPPVGNVKLNIKFRDGDVQIGATALGTRWTHFGGESDVVEYMIVTDEKAVEQSEQKPAPTASDGGSSGYYKFTIENEAGETIQCEMKDIIRCVYGDNFSLGNIAKAARRMYEASQGRGKEGASIAYDANKVRYFASEFERWNKGE